MFSRASHPIVSVARRSTTLVVVATTLGLAYGIWYSYSVILVALLHEFGWSRSLLAGAFSLFAIVHGMTNPVVGFLCDRIKPPILVGTGGFLLGIALWINSLISEPWQLYLSFGVFAAISVSTCGWVPAVVMVEKRYQHRLGFALGIVSSGIGVGMLVVVPICQLLIDAYGWRVAYRVLAVTCTGTIVPIAFYLAYRGKSVLTPMNHSTANVRDTSTDKREEPTSINLREATRTLPFWLMVAAFFFGSTCSQTLHVHQVAYLVDHGISAIIAASVVGFVGAASIVGKTGGGWLSDRFDREVVFACGIAILVFSVLALVVVGRYPSTIGVAIYAIMLGVGYSATASIVPAMVSDRFSGLYFGSILGIGLFGSALGSAFGPWMAGYLFDRFGSYNIAFVMAVVSGLIAGTAGWVARRIRLNAERAEPVQSL